MGTLFRSEEMTLCQFFLQAESAYTCVSELGELGLVQFRDLNPEVNAFQRKFTNEVRRCDEMERKLRFLQKEIQKDGIPMLDTGDNPSAPLPREMIDLESTLEKLEIEMKEVNTNAGALKKNFLELTELKQILRKTHTFFDESAKTKTYKKYTPNTKNIYTSNLLQHDDDDDPDIMIVDEHTRLINDDDNDYHQYSQRSHYSNSIWHNIRSQIFGSNAYPPISFEMQMNEPPGGRTDEARSLLPSGSEIGSNQGTPDIRASITGKGAVGIPLDFTAGTNAALKLGFVAGVLLQERFPAFERLLWRACRGNVFLRRSEIDVPLEDPITGEKVNKVVFMIFFQGDQLKSRVRKICEAFGATLYPCPETAAERREMEMGVMTRIEDLSTVLSQTQEHRHRVLVAAAKNIKTWFIKVRKIKAIYHTLNMFSLDVTQKCLIAEGWCPVPELDKIQLALRRGEENSGSTVPCIVNRMDYGETIPPTYNRTNKYTSGFQNIVDAYGAAKYREVNPTPYTIVTFPFLFSVMFGDAGHGLLMAIVGLFMIVRERALARASRNETFGIFFGGRYIILMMGLFSIYTGLMYNDIFSKSINVFGSSWRAGGNYTPADLTEMGHVTLDPADPTSFAGFPYPYGVDPVWQLSKNKITFSNSYKMKISIILGVIHMLLGIVLSLYNHVYFRQPINIFCEFLPQILFLFCLFGYLCIVIFVKWIKFNALNSRCAPSLLINLINMFLLSYPPQEKGNPCSPYLYRGQKPLQYALVIIALICVPWMLLVKPLILRSKNKYYLKRKTRLMGMENPVVDVHHSTSPGIPNSRRLTGSSSITPANAPRSSSSQHGLLSPDNTHPPDSRRSSDARSFGDNSGPMGTIKKGSLTKAGPEAAEPEFNFPEIMIEQAIHTIEFCLGCLSHTASYLRLWALSLAHAQLSEVLWNMVFRVGFSFQTKVGSVVIFCVFAIWAVLTVSILLFMEGLSAFLHALRLHWVEFQSKFYAGTGYLFEPFSFQHILNSVAIIGMDET